MQRYNFQLTVEDVEYILDMLGPELDEDDQVKRHLRRRLQELLQFAREQNPTQNIG